MLKKKLFLTSLATLSLLCTSCEKGGENSTSSSSTNLTYQTDPRFMPQRNENASLIELTYEEVEAKILKEESFILYIKQTGCLACKAFSPILESYVNKTKISVYMIDTYNIPANNTKLIYEYTPTIQIFKKGKMIDFQDPIKSEINMFNNLKDLMIYFNNFIIENNQLFISDTTLDSMITNKESFIIYFTWKSCGDCQMMNKMFLEEYLYNTKDEDQTLYVLEVEPWRSQKNDNPEVWENFTSKYHLSKTSDEKFGYRTGVVPTIQYYEKGILTDAVVYFNDVLTVDKNEAGEITAYRIDFEASDGVFSYYPKEILSLYKDTKFSDYQNYKDITNDFYKNKLLDLFNKYYK